VKAESAAVISGIGCSQIGRRLHRDPLFKMQVEDPAVLDIVSDLLGPNLDCFLSQFIFKNHGAMGQPWHQDSYYFAFDNRPQVGVWLAVTEATLENGCLHVMPGSHREPVHEHVPDRRPNAQYGYTEIVDYDMSNSVPVLMQPGDLLVFHSHLMLAGGSKIQTERSSCMLMEQQWAVTSS